MKTLYIMISLCFTYLLHKCMPTNHLNAYNNAPMGFPQRGRNRLVPSFWQRLLLTVKTAYVPFFSPLGVPICIHVQRFFLTKENNKGHSFKLSCVSVLCKMV